jgi:membrane associated rhomboid family serine protease
VIEVRRADGRIQELSFEEFEAEIRDGRLGPDAEVRFAPSTGDRFVAARSLELFTSVENDPRTRFEREFTLQRVPWTTVATGVLLVLVFLQQLQDAAPAGTSGFVWAPPPSGIEGADLLRQGAKFLPHQLEFGEWWRLLTASLLHVHWWHLGWNLVYILYVGWSVESVIGASGMSLLVVGTAIASMAASSAATPELSAGASGICLGVFGAAVALGWRLGPWLPSNVRVRFGWPMFVWVVYFFVLGAVGPGFIDHFCHLGGLGAGVAGGLLLPYRPAGGERWKSSRWFRVLAAILLAGFVGVGLPLASDLGLLPRAPLSASPVVELENGLELHVPERWKEARAEHGAAMWSSRTATARVTVGGWVEPWGPPTEEQVRDRWREEQAATYRAVEFERERPDLARFGLSTEWFGQTSDVVSGGLLLRALRLGAIRGTHVVTVEFLHHSDRWDDYEHLRRSILETIRFVEPASVRRARDAVAGRLVDSPEAAYTYAEALARVGRGDEAWEALSPLGTVSNPPEGLDYLRLWIQHHLDGVPPSPDSLADARMLLNDATGDGVPLRDMVLATQVLWGFSPGSQATLDALARLRARDPELARMVMGSPLSPR